MPETALQVPFDLAHWQRVAAEKYPNGLPEPESDDPTQWLFHGRPEASTAPLQVAVARLLGYRWPAEVDAASIRVEVQETRQDAASTMSAMRLSLRARELVRRCDELLEFADDDGIVCIPPVRGEHSAADRLVDVLAKAYGSEWYPQRVQELLTATGFSDRTLDDWLRNGFFEQHCRLFHHRPFIWQIWDGHREGFSALVNYHRLIRKALESLTYTYLDDGVRLNIRPFVEAGVLRWKPNIKWGKDRGKNPPGSPWGEERNNDLHLTLAEKRSARGLS